jgi:hypothetical protein
VVFVVPVVHEAIDVQDVEEGARSNGQLKEKNDSRFRDAECFEVAQKCEPQEMLGQILNLS